MAAVTVTSITNEAIKYQEELRYLPYKELLEVLPDEGIRLLEVADRDIETTFERKRGGLRPYDPATINYADLGKMGEMELQVNKCVYPIKDSILNYSTKKILGKPQAGDGVNQTKKHPLEMLILREKGKTVGEDILDALYSGVRSVADQTPSGTMNGYDKLIDDAVTATTISLANGNLVNTGVLATPVDDTDTLAVDRLVLFVRAADRFLRKNGLLKITANVYQFAIDALGNKIKNHSLVDNDMLERYINVQARAIIKLVVSDNMGTGTRVHLTTPDNFDLGMNTFGDWQYVQVRSIFEDPNLVQFWTQLNLGARIRGFHKKVFQVSEQAVAHADLSSDYS